MCHRDIKLENFVFEGPGDDAELKLIDFGLSSVVQKGAEEMHAQVGTVMFMAPEVLETWIAKAGARHYNTACDIWALGVATYELLAGPMRRPYNKGPVNHGASKQLKIIRKAGPCTPPATEPPLTDDAASFLAQARATQQPSAVTPYHRRPPHARVIDSLRHSSQMLALSPAQRLSAAQALAHPWLAGAEAEGSKPRLSRVESEKLASARPTHSALPTPCTFL